MSHKKLIRKSPVRVERGHTTNEGATMADGRGPDLHQEFHDYLLERVRSDRYPSTAMLDMLERGVANEQERAALVDALLEKVQSDRYPSMPMLRRIARLAG